MGTYILIGLVIVLIVAYKRGVFDNKKQDVVAPVGGFFPCILEGNIDMPPMDEVTKAAIIDVKEAGLWRDGMADSEAMALCSAPLPNALNFGGGGAYGGRYLTGSFRFEIDAVGQQTGDSWVKIFSDDKYTVTGGITGDGTIAMGSIGGTNIVGTVTKGSPFGKILHGDGKHYIYGVLNGTYTKL